jgi:hypothetical protein
LFFFILEIRLRCRHRVFNNLLFGICWRQKIVLLDFHQKHQIKFNRKNKIPGFYLFSCNFRSVNTKNANFINKMKRTPKPCVCNVFVKSYFILLKLESTRKIQNQVGKSCSFGIQKLAFSYPIVCTLVSTVFERKNEGKRSQM